MYYVYLLTGTVILSALTMLVIHYTVQVETTCRDCCQYYWGTREDGVRWYVRHDCPPKTRINNPEETK